MRDPWGVKCRHDIGVDILLWGSDFAHATGDWPNSQKVINDTFAGVTKEERHKMLAGNAIRFFHLDAIADLDASWARNARASRRTIAAGCKSRVSGCSDETSNDRPENHKRNARS